MARKMVGSLLVAVWMLFGLNTPSIAGVSATGEFTATKGCQAYQSIKRKTNPGDMQLEIGQSYPVIELNVSPGTTWYRLRIDNATPVERWKTEWDADGYFAVAMRLLEEFNTSGVAAFMTENIGKSVPTSSFFAKIDNALGADASRRLQISCTHGMLVDVYIRLPAKLPEGASLSTLIQQAEPAFNNKCGPTFQVDAIGQ